MSFREQLRTQRWDDHRYYHHSRINQSLHFVSALASGRFLRWFSSSIRHCLVSLRHGPRRLISCGRSPRYG